jgi:hypothetical protein
MRGIQPVHPTQPTGLLDIPLEIRLEIYRYSLIRREPIKLHFLKFLPDRGGSKKHTVVLISRQLSEEALDVLYGENVFEVRLHYGSQRILNKFAPANRQRIRRLQLFVHFNYISCTMPLSQSLHILRPTLASLTRLYIVALQPLLGATNCDNAPMLEQEMHKWLTNCKAILEYVNQHVSSRATIEVDNNEKEETSELAKKCLSNGYRNVRTGFGDIFFRRTTR